MRTLKEIREANDLTIRSLAVKAGVSPNTVCRMEQGLPSRRTTKNKIAKTLHKKPSDIDFNLSYKLP
jgi:transcriptional regulator with XRE-family HTH domain